MTSKGPARDEILRRIRSASAGAEPAVPRDYHGPGEVIVADPVELLAERLIDYRAGVRRCPWAETAQTIAATLVERRAEAVLLAAGFPLEWAPSAACWDDPPLSLAELDAVSGVVTTCAIAVASTGTIVLDAGPGQGRRALTLVPDYHLVVVRTDQIVAAIPDAVSRLDPVRPLTWISGPSATSDIELNRVEGVHGPRTLDVIITGPPPDFGPPS